MKTQLLLAVAAVCTAAPAFAQFQASTDAARKAGLQVKRTGFNQIPPADQIAISGPPNAAFVMFAEFGHSSDIAYSYNLGVQSNPWGINLVNPLTVSVNGVLDAQGNASFTYGAAWPLMPGVTVRWQAAVTDPLSSAGIAASNSVTRETSTGIGSPNLAGTYTKVIPGAEVLTDDYLDVERGDVDGDGDLDTLLLSCSGSIYVHENVVGGQDTFSFVGALGGATSMELADLNNDNFLDLVVSIDGIFQMAVYQNQGRVPGSPVMGAWNGFMIRPLASVAWDSTIPVPALSIDVESADFDQDGLIDLALACAGDPMLGIPNRLLQNTTVGVGGPITFTEVSLPVLFGPDGLFYDDTEDVEFYDLDNDGDYDLVFANVDGPLAVVGRDYVYINQINLGVVGFVRQDIIAAPIDDETLDVVVKDLNGDGFPDIYAANWYSSPTNTGNFGANMPVFDRLYLTAGAPLVWTDQSQMLPDNPGFVGPVAFAVPPFASSDSETVDADNFGFLGWGPDEVIVSAGNKCGTIGNDATRRGLRLLHYVPPMNGVPAHYVNDRFLGGGGLSLLPADVATMLNINDVETGDWQQIWKDVDMGIASLQVPVVSPGYVWLTR